MSEDRPSMRRAIYLGSAVTLWAFGVALIAFPFVTDMLGKTGAGADMMADLAPIMTRADVDVTKTYLVDLHVLQDDLVPVLTPEAMVRFQAYLRTIQAMDEDYEKLLPALASQMGITPQQFEAALKETAPGVAQALERAPAMREDLAALAQVTAKDMKIIQAVPAYLAHYDNLVARMDRNVPTFDDANELPIDLVPWLFIGFGAITAFLATVLLAASVPLVRR